jgi:adenylosuccinate synthase
LSSVLEQKNRVLTKLYDAQPFSLDEIHRQYYDYGQRLGRFVHDAEFMVQDVVASGGLVILEGSQGTLLDLDFGTYPYVTSSSATAAGGPVGIGLSPSRVDKVLGVFKAYTTRVGAGPMPTELKDEVGETIRDRGQEYGATTGRARRCGWFDAVAARYSARVNGLDGAALMRLDVLDDFPYVKLCTGYEIDGSVTTAFPVSSEVLDKCQPVYEMMPGWSESTTGTRRFKDLPVAAQGFVSRVEELIGCSIDLVSVGADREQSIIIKPIF